MMSVRATIPATVQALCLFGPTASGKSALALALAERLDAVIVNADSMQVYRDLAVLTARPTPAEMASAPHRLYGEVDAASRFSVARWLEAALTAIAEARAAGRLAILVGGTGLYFKALTEGLAPTPEIAPGPARLAGLDPEGAARLAPRDAPRVLRALEVALTAGASLAALQRATRPPLAPDAWRGIALAPPRERLYAAIDARAAAMFAAGAVEEASALIARGLDPALPAMKAHGVPPIARWLAGGSSRAEALNQTRLDTRHYAKRQFTWMRGQLAAWPRIAAEALDQRLAAVEAVMS